jgi:hypothetical protein
MKKIWEKLSSERRGKKYKGQYKFEGLCFETRQPQKAEARCAQS